jgi:hypothetical protein
LTLADAVVTELNGQTWAIDAPAVRSYADDEESLESSGPPRLDVIPPETYEQEELSTRGSEARTATIRIALRQRFGQAERDDVTGGTQRDAIDRNVSALEQMGRHLSTIRLSGCTNAAWLDSRTQLYRRDHLRQLNQFTGTVDVTYRISDDLQ